MNSKEYKGLSGIYNILKIIFRSLPLLWSAAPVETSLLGIILFVQGLIPSVSVWLTKIIVDEVVSVANGNNMVLPVIGVVSLWGSTLFIQSAVGPLAFMLIGNLNEKLTAYINLLLMQKSSQIPDLYAFESVNFYNDIQILKEQAGSRPLNLVIILVDLLRGVLTLGGMLFLLGTLQWWFPIIILIFVIPQSLVILRLQRSTWTALIHSTPESRKMNYFCNVMMSGEHAKEVRIFNLGPYFIEKFSTTFKNFHHSMRKIRYKKIWWTIPAISLCITGNVFVFWWVISHALSGDISAGDVILFIQALSQTNQYLLGLLENFGFLYERILFFEKLFIFLEYKSPMEVKEPNLSIKPSLNSSIVFKDVAFRYPDGFPALKNINFAIQAGEKIALVGENGAGKSTIVKLLTRLYDPTEGEILIDGINLRSLDLQQWRTMIGTIFQDFGRYNLTLGENINLGNINGIKNKKLIHIAAERAGLSHVVKKFPDLHETLLGKIFDGTELSGGEWQKVALARAFIKESELLILDEPTASLDPRSEYELFLRFSELTNKKTALMVTHRLASVHMVDRIFFLKNGEISEAGSHSDLLQLNGEYKTLYSMQADFYSSSKGQNCKQSENNAMESLVEIKGG